jgi:hypothetical protein
MALLPKSTLSISLPPLNLHNLNLPLPPLRVLNPINHIIILLIRGTDAQRADTDAFLIDAFETGVSPVGNLAFVVAAGRG